MYGLVNIAIRDLISTEHGAETWRRIRERAGVETDTFIAMETYPDSVSYALVSAASEILEVRQEALLEAFGEYWMSFTAKQGYGETLDFAGSDIEEFLEHLDDMHARIALSFPELDPPSFRTERAADGRLELHYHTERPGLAPMVVGLLRGLGKRFNQAIEIEYRANSGAPGDHDIFLLSIEEKTNLDAA